MDPNDRGITGFAMLGHGMFHTYELSIPIFMVLWLEEFGVSAATLGLVVGAGYAIVGVGALPSGVLSDAYGSKRLVLASMLGMGGGFVVLGLATGLASLAAALLLWGVAASLYHPAGLSLLSRAARDREMAFGYHGAAGNVGTGLGPLAVAVLLVALDWREVALLFMLPGLLGLLVARRIDFDEAAADDDAAGAGAVPADAPTNGGEDADGAGTDAGGGVAPVDAEAEIRNLSGLLAETRTMFTSGFVVVLGIGALVGLYYRGAFTFLPTVLDGLPFLEPVTAFGRSFDPGRYIYAALLTVGAFGQIAGGKLGDAVRAEYALVGTFGLLLASTLLFIPASRTGVWPLVALSFAIGFTFYMQGPITQELIATYVRSDVHGLSFGYTYLAMYGIGAVGASLAGAALTYTDADGLFVLLAGIAATAMLLGVLLSRRSPAESASA